MMSASNVTWAVRYIEKYGLALVPIPPGHKAPRHPGWNQPGGYVTDAGEARQRWGDLPDHGIGVVLAPSGLCSFDVDSPEHAEPVLGALGVDLGALRKSAPTIQGNPARSRVMFRAPPGVVLGRKTLAWPAGPAGGKPLTLFELRAGDIQDVLPPTIHPDIKEPYTWLTAPNSEFPPLPEDLLELWQHWDSYRAELEAMCPWANHGFNPEPAPRGGGARPNVIAAFNATHSVEELIEAHGYTRRGNRWMSPTSSSGLAGVVILDGRVYSHHGSDPLADGHTHDAFDLFRILAHGGGMKSAIRAAEDLGTGSTAGARASAGPGGRQDAEDAPRGFHGGEAVYRRLFDIQPKPILWLWRGRIARGKVFMLAGHPGLGKSQAMISMAAIVTTGGTWPVDRTPCERGAVIILSAEDDAEDTIRPRLEAAGADLKGSLSWMPSAKRTRTALRPRGPSTSRRIPIG